MSVSLFPSIQPAVHEAPVNTTSELYREVQWDFDNNIPIYKNGSPVVITGKNAVLVWAWKALNTPRFRHVIYTWNYGNETDSLIGRPYSDAIKRSEAARYIRECLLINPYISDVSNVSVSFLDGALSVKCRINTIYGEADINV